MKSMVYVVILHYLGYSLVTLGFHCLYLVILTDSNDQDFECFRFYLV